MSTASQQDQSTLEKFTSVYLELIKRMNLDFLFGD